MSRKRTVYKTEFKTKLVLEVLKGEQTINEIASKYNVTPNNIQNWKKIFYNAPKNQDNFSKDIIS